MDAAIGQRQRGVRARRDEAGILPGFGEAGVGLLLLQPAQLVGKPLAIGTGQLKLQQEALSMVSLMLPSNLPKSGK
jgi:hypothetical protein